MKLTNKFENDWRKTSIHNIVKYISTWAGIILMTFEIFPQLFQVQALCPM